MEPHMIIDPDGVMNILIGVLIFLAVVITTISFMDTPRATPVGKWVVEVKLDDRFGVPVVVYRNRYKSLLDSQRVAELVSKKIYRKLRGMTTNSLETDSLVVSYSVTEAYSREGDTLNSLDLYCVN